MCTLLFEGLISILWDIYPGVEVRGHMVTLCLTYLGAAKPFPAVAAIFHTPAVYEGPSFPISSTKLVIVWVL